MLDVVRHSILPIRSFKFIGYLKNNINPDLRSIYDFLRKHFDTPAPGATVKKTRYRAHRYRYLLDSINLDAINGVIGTVNIIRPSAHVAEQ